MTHDAERGSLTEKLLDMNGVLSSLISCQVSDPASGTVGAFPRGVGGRDRSRHGITDVRAREHGIAAVREADQGGTGAGIGSVAVTVSPSELRDARVVGQVRFF